MTESNVLYCGIDVGSETTKVVLGNGEIVRNEVGGHTTPTAVSLSWLSQAQPQQRQIGQAASRKSSVTLLNRFLSGEIATQWNNPPALVRPKEDDGTDTREWKFLPTNNPSDETSFSPTALLAMLLGNVQANVQATVSRLFDDHHSNTTIHYVLAIPPETSVKAQTEWKVAAYAAGMDTVSLVASPQAYAHHRKLTTTMTSSSSILVVDMGHTQTVATLLQPSTGDRTTTVAAQARNAQLGAGHWDWRLLEHVCQTHPALTTNLSPKIQQRLLEGCQKLKHLLSQLSEAKVTVENVVGDGGDVQLSMTRNEFQSICQTELRALRDLLLPFLSSDQPLTAIEVVGGGCRIPMVKDAILEACGSSVTMLSYSLDDTSLALGATAAAQSSLSSSNEEASDTFFEWKTALRTAEDQWKAHDRDQAVRAEAMNALEAHILELRAAQSHPLLADALDGYLQDLDDWLFSEQADASNGAQMQEKLQSTLSTSRTKYAAYYEALQKEKDEKERVMEQEAAVAALERQGAANDDEDDHDNRRLPKKRRMEIVLKNKAEANELFSDGNFQFAAARYTKALTHCSKFVDLSPDDVQEVNGVKLSLNLNLALAYFKLGKMDQSLRVCNEALALDAKSTKALYRRAAVYMEKKDWTGAQKDVQTATVLAPQDKAIQKLSVKVEAQLKKQKQKERKMAQKMFG